VSVSGWGRLVAAAGPTLLLIGALVPELRPPLALAMAIGWLVLRAGRRVPAIGWAAVVPLAIVLAWPWVLGPDLAVGDPACRDPLTVIVRNRVLVAVVGLSIVALVGIAHGSDRRELGLQRPGRREAMAAVGGGIMLVVAGLVIGPVVARPFFGSLDFPVPVGALLPALAFGIANGVLEEVLYRGAMQAWLGRLAPIGIAIAFQGLVFGIVHVGPEVIDLAPVHVALLTAVGVAAGLVRWRVGSLWIQIGIHVGADVALYIGLACRAPS
jgi:membrane protease YdiL (CAAX protease family)